jgi:hypothetical protein
MLLEAVGFNSRVISGLHATLLRRFYGLRMHLLVGYS